MERHGRGVQSHHSPSRRRREARRLRRSTRVLFLRTGNRVITAASARKPPRSSLARARWRLLVEPGLVAALVGGDTLGEPQGDLVLGGLDGVGTVDDVAAELDAEVAADGTGLGGAEEGGEQNGEGRSGSAAGRRLVRAKGRDAGNLRRRYGARRRDGGRSARVRARLGAGGRNWRRSAGTDRIAEDRARVGVTHRGLVAPMILRPVLTTSLPSQTMHTTGPEHM